MDTLEGQVCKIADIVAYISHDIGDAIREEFLTEDRLPRSVVQVLGDSTSKRINTMVCDIIEHSARTMESGRPAICMGAEVQEAASTLREFLFEEVYLPCSMTEESRRAGRVVQLLYEYYLEHPEELPEEYAMHADTTERSVTDYVAGMTDPFALRRAASIQERL